MRIIYCIFAALIFCFPGYSQSPGFEITAEKLEKLKRSEPLQLLVRIEERELVLTLRPTSVTANNYKEIVLGPDNSNGQEAVLFSGRVRPKVGSKDFVKLTYLPTDELEGLMRVSGLLYNLTSVKIDKAIYLIVSEYETNIAHDKPGTCEAHEAPESSASLDTLASAVADGALKEIELGIQIDYPLYQQFGSTSNAYNKILAVVNAANGILEQDLGLTNRVVVQRIYTSSAADPYTSTDSGVLLNEFRTDWRDNVSDNYDNAHLFSGREFDGSVIGRAWLSALCGSFKYGINEYFSSNQDSLKVLFAHEQGHNLGANHDTDIMSASISRSANKYSDTSIDEIAARVPSFSCLSDVSAGTAPVLATIPDQTVIEGGTLSLSLNATDADGGMLSYSVEPLSSGMSISGNSFNYTPPTSVVQTCGNTRDVTYNFEVEDDSGNTDSQAVIFTIRDISFARPPALAAISTQSANQGRQLSVQFSANDDAEDVITYSATNLPAGATLDTSSGQFLWTPSLSQLGTFLVTARATDCAGQTSIRTFEIVVDGVSPPLNLRIESAN